MKRVLAIILMAVVLSVSGLAAVETGFGARIAVGAGLGSGDDWNDYVDSFNGNNMATFNFGGGAFFDFKMTDSLAFGVEALYCKLSSKLEDTVGDTLKYVVPTIQMPITLKFSYSSNSKSSSYFFAGPDLFFVVGDTEAIFDIDGDEYSVDGETENDFAMGLIVGVGGEYAMGSSGAFVFDVRYSRTLGEIFDGAWYFNMIQCGVGYKVTFGK